MKIYSPIPIGLPIEEYAFTWDLRRVVFSVAPGVRGIYADITAKGLWPRAVRVSFSNSEQTRIIAEEHYSVSDAEHEFQPRSGWLAYFVTGDEFFDRVVEWRRQLKHPANFKHYAFFGQNDWLEVISDTPPTFQFVELDSESA